MHMCVSVFAYIHVFIYTYMYTQLNFACLHTKVWYGKLTARECCEKEGRVWVGNLRSRIVGSGTEIRTKEQNYWHRY